jgi:hypothetical protein
VIDTAVRSSEGEGVTIHVVVPASKWKGVWAGSGEGAGVIAWKGV